MDDYLAVQLGSKLKATMMVGWMVGPMVVSMVGLMVGALDDLMVGVFVDSMVIQ
jgi:hypothetical protein